MTKPLPRRSKTTGISLLEIMVVLAIIALVVGLAAPRLMGNFGFYNKITEVDTT